VLKAWITLVYEPGHAHYLRAYLYQNECPVVKQKMTDNQSFFAGLPCGWQEIILPV
jgi:hypothetical protein